MDFLRRVFFKKKKQPEPEEEKEEVSVLDIFLQAVEDEDIIKVEELIDGIEDINATTSDHETSAISVAADKKALRIVELLLKKGASPNGGNPNMASPLMNACQNCDRTTARFLINSGADVNYEDEDGVTALVIAARLGDSQMVRTLMEHHANVNQQVKKEKLPTGVLIATYQGMSDEDRVYNFEPFFGNTVLMGACRERELEVVRLLLRHGADVNPTNEYGNTALHVAAHAKSQTAYYTSKPHWRFPPTCQGVVQVLLEHGAKVNDRNMIGETPLDRTVSQLKSLAEDGGIPEWFISHYKNFSLLLNACSPMPNKHLDSSQENKSLYSILLRAFKQMQPIDDHHECLGALVQAIKDAVKSGIKVDPETIDDFKSEMNDSSKKQDLLEWLDKNNA